MSNNSIEQLMTISLRHISKESETLLFQNGKAEGDYVYCMLAFYNPTAHRLFAALYYTVTVLAP